MKGARGGRKLALIGAGNMAEALLRGLLASGLFPARDVLATAPRAERRSQLETAYGIRVSADNCEAAAQADVLVLAVKPQILDSVMAEIAAVLRPDVLVVSIAAGVPMAAIQSRLGAERRICRAMPNTPALVGAGATAIAMSANAKPEDVDLAKSIFEAVGMVTVVDETLLDAVTGLSGSGPAYVFMIIEALADAGVKVGLPRRQAQALAAQTVLGSAKLLIDTGQHPGVLKDQVTSPGGTAIAGLHTLEEGGLRTTLINAVQAATNRSRELGELRAKPK